MVIQKKQRYEFKFDTKQLFLLIIGEIIICGLVLTLGVMIGHNIAPKSDKILSKDMVKPYIPTKEEMTFYETLTSPEEYINEDNNIAQKPTSREKDSKNNSEKKITIFAEEAGDKNTKDIDEKTASNASKNTSQTTKKKAKSPKVKKIQPKKIAKKSTPQRPKKNIVKKTSDKQYTLQISSHRTRDLAETLKKKLKNRGYKAYILSIDLGDKGMWHRVRVGKYKSREDAEKVANQLRVREKLSGTMITLWE